MAGPLASLYIKLGLDATEVEKGANKAKEALGGITKGSVLRAAGVAVTSGLAFATKGALAMEDASARFRAETGASADEAQRFAEYVNAASGSTVLGMDQIADTATKVRTDMGLVGDEMAAQTDLFLRYERATSQGAEAVGAYDDILDAWNLTAADTQKVMDSLVASHQAYGGAVTADQDALAKLAPAFQAANMGWEDAVALINAAKDSGLDASEMVMGLTTALAKVESPRELQALIDHIASIEDPADRAAAAIDAFGTRGGLKLAQALSHGGLDKYRQGLDEVAGATDRAADAIDDTWTTKIRKAINAANSLLTGFAMNLGPMLTGAMSGISLLGSLGLDKAKLKELAGPLKAGLTSMLAKVGLEGAGTAVASKFAAAFAAALPIVGVAAIGAAIGVAIGKAIIGPEVERAMKEEAGKAGAALAGAGTLDELKRQKAVLEKGLADAEAVPFSNFLFGSSDQLRQQIADVDAKIARLTDAASSSLTKGLAGAAGGVGKPTVTIPAPQVKVAGKLGTGALRKAVESQAGGISEAWDAVSAAFNKGPKIQSLSSRLKKGRQALRHAMSQMRRAVKAGDPLAASYWADQYNKVEHSLAGMRGSADETMANVAQTMARGRKRFGRSDKGLTADARRQADIRAKQAAEKSDKMAGALPDALRDAKPETATTAKAQAAAAKAPLSGLAADAATWGGHMGQRYAAGLRSAIPEVGSAAAAVAGAAAGPLRFSAPPKHGPLKSIRSWGPHMIEHWAKGTEGALGRVGRTADAWAKAATPSMGTRWQPAAAYAVGPRGRSAMAGRRPSGGDTHIHVGTLIANDAGINDLRKRMARSERIRRRDRWVPDSPNGRGR